MEIKLEWSIPTGEMPKDWVEWQAFTDTHVLRIWVNVNGDWCGQYRVRGTWERRQVDIKADSEKEAMYQLEKAYFSKELA